MQPTRLQVARIGGIARQILAHSPSLTVWGTVTHGVYLINPKQEIVFLSNQPQSGPLTLNLSPRGQPLPALPRNGKLTGDPGNMALASQEYVIDYSRAEEWLPLPTEAYDPPPYSLLERPGELIRLTEEIPSMRSHPLWSAFCAWLPAWESPAHAPGASSDWIYPELGFSQRGLFVQFHAITQALAAGGLSLLADCMQVWIGRGPGLTPSGDDLILGLVLALNRHAHLRSVNLDLGEFNRAIYALSRAGATALSACLIACAAQGQADERLIAALDSLVAGSGALTADLTRLSGWGARSGFDALTGMALACAAARSTHPTLIDAEAYCEN